MHAELCIKATVWNFKYHSIINMHAELCIKSSLEFSKYNGATQSNACVFVMRTLEISSVYLIITQTTPPNYHYAF